MFKNFDKKFLIIKLIKYFNYEKLNKLLQVLDFCLIYFEFKKSNDSCGGDDSKIRIDELNKRLNILKLKLKLEDLIVGTQNARSEFIKRVSHKKSDYNEDEEFIEEDNEDNDDVTILIMEWMMKMMMMNMLMVLMILNYLIYIQQQMNQQQQRYKNNRQIL